uniref:Uncharacterized protein n=1 Tax=Brassica oleracea TaxID=3712 RepID=A0A3P6DZ03_BRAOL|nr:unnamed protein product [Brassica oleracea]
MAALSDYFCDIVEECIENNLSKDETMRHLWDKYLIPHEYTNIGRIQIYSYHTMQGSVSAIHNIQSNTEQIVKLLTDVHGFGPHPSAAVSIKRRRTEEAEERGNSEEAEKKQKKEKLHEKKEDGGGEILQDQNLQLQQLTHMGQS